jgi:TRAP-type C4-dicarboxylate transport system permease small subunit
LTAFLTSVDRAGSALARFFALLACAILLWMMALTVVAVIMRKIFDAPILGVNDLDQLSLIALVFFGIAYCGYTRGHISVDMIESFVGRKVLIVLDVIVNMCGGIFLLVVSWHTVLRAVDAKVQNDATNMLFAPLFPFYLMVAGGFALYAFLLIIHALRAAIEPRELGAC